MLGQFRRLQRVTFHLRGGNCSFNNLHTIFAYNIIYTGCFCFCTGSATVASGKADTATMYIDTGTAGAVAGATAVASIAV